MKTNLIRTLALAAALAVTALVAPPAAFAGGDWNDGGIAWQPFDKGVAAAKEAKKPILLVFYTDWCPHCTNYSKVFHDEKVVAKSKDFVMIRLNKDQNKELSAKYAPDGEYIPRTYFLAPDGTLDADLNAGRPQYKYFYDVVDPGSIMAGMDRALAKLK